jgi:cytochrome c553
MKRLALLIIGLLCLAAAAILVGCGGSTESPVSTTTEPGASTTATATTAASTATATPAVSSCVSCHTDKARLQDTATEVVAAAPEEASGEG